MNSGTREIGWTTLPRSGLTRHLAGYRVGRGPRMLLVHGVGMRADFWSALVPGLEAHFSLSVIDLPGHGESPRLAGSNATLADYGDVLAELLQASSDPWIVVGHSLGALLALDLAVRHGSRVAGIGVLNGVYRRSAEAREAIRVRVAELSGRAEPDSLGTLGRWFGDAPEGNDARAAAACREWLASADRAGYRDAYRVFAASDAPSDSALRGIRARALVMTGALEPNSTPAMASSLCALLPDARCLIVDGARHMLPMTHGEVLRRALVDRFGEPTMTDAGGER